MVRDEEALKFVELCLFYNHILNFGRGKDGRGF